MDQQAGEADKRKEEVKIRMEKGNMEVMEECLDVGRQGKGRKSTHRMIDGQIGGQ